MIKINIPNILTELCGMIINRLFSKPLAVSDGLYLRIFTWIMNILKF